jgi:hypothetical protein
MNQYNPDTQPFDLALSNLPPFGREAERAALIDVSDTVDFAKRILLQHRVKNFTAADVVRLAEMIMSRSDFNAAKGNGDATK